MVEFVTLLLGLIVGQRSVQVAVGDEVAAVVLQLDGVEVASLDASPWTAEVDFGDELEPRRLTALALDDAGRPLGEAVQLVNYARSSYEAVILLAPAPPGEGRDGRVAWRAVLDQDPLQVVVRFDGQPLAVGAEGEFRLPPHAPDRIHSLEAELFFSRRTIRAEMSLGGGFGDRVKSALTAIPITGPPGQWWRPEQVSGWLEREGEPLAVFTTRAEPGRLVVLRDASLRGHLRALRRELERLPAPPAGAGGPIELTAVAPRPVKAHPGTFRLADLGPGHSLDRLERLLLDADPLVSAGRHPLSRRQQLWNALAVAGANGAESNRPRAVLLLIGDLERDHSLLSPGQASRYLRSILVPLLVWAPEPGMLERVQLDPEIRTFTGAVGLRELLRAAAGRLASQTMVWVEGEHLPNEIRLGPSAPPQARLAR